MGIYLIPDHQWDFDTTNKANDQIGNVNFSEFNSPSYSDTGGKFAGEGYVYSNDHNAYLRNNTSHPITADEQPWTYLAFFYLESGQWSNGDGFLRLAFTSPDAFTITTLATTGEIRISIDGKTGIDFYDPVTTVPEGQWVLIALVADPDNSLVHVWIDGTKLSYDDNGHFGPSTDILLKGHGTSDCIYGKISHARLYKDFVPTATDIAYFMEHGEFVIHIPSDTRILKVTDGTKLSDILVKVEGQLVGGVDYQYPRSRYKLDTTDEGADNLSTYDLTETGDGTIVWSDNGLHGSGYADFSDDTGDDNLRLERTGSFGGSANGAFTYGAFFKFSSWPTGSSVYPIQIIGATNDHTIRFRIASSGVIEGGRKAKTGSAASQTHTSSPISTGVWYWLGIGHDPDNDEVFFWVDNVKMALTDLGDHDYTESGTDTRLGGSDSVNGGADCQVSHGSMYIDRVVTTADVNQILSGGEIFTESGIDSSTAIFRAAFADYTRSSDTRMKVLASADYTRVSDTTVAKRTDYTRTGDSRIKREGFADYVRISDTKILGITDMQLLSDTRIEVLGNLVEPDSDTRILTVTLIEPTSDTRIKRLTGGIIGKISSTFILHVTDTQITSSTAVFRGAYNDIQLTSGTRIEEFQDFDKTSDARIKVIDNEETLASDTLIIRQTDVTVTSDTFILRVTDKQLISDTRLLKTSDYTRVSNTRVLATTDSQLLSSTRIKSSLFIQIYYRSDTTISNRIDYSRSSGTAIKRTSFDDVTVTSDAEIVRLTEVTLTSQTAIQVQQETSERSMTTIAKRTELTTVSDTHIKVGANEITAISDTKIIRVALGTQIQLLSGTRIEGPDRPVVDYISDTAIVASADVQITSGVTIKGRTGQYTATFRKAPGRFS